MDYADPYAIGVFPIELQPASGPPPGSPQQVVAPAAEEAELGPLELRPYGMRHCGASTDCIRKVRSLLAIKKRGRWESDASLVRYEKGGRLLTQLNKLAPAVRQKALAADRRLPEVLHGTWSPL